MKKTKMVCAAILLSCTLLSAQNAPSAFSAFVNGSDITNLLGVEYQRSVYSLSFTWKPVSDNADSYAASFTVYQQQWYRDSPYFSVSYISSGYPHSRYLPAFGDYDWRPSVSLIAGYKTVMYEATNRMSCKVGLGWNFSDCGSCFAFEVGVSFVLFNNVNKLNNDLLK